MAQFNSMDICTAHYMFATLFHKGQGSAIYRKFGQLDNLRFNPPRSLSKPSQLNSNAKEIYLDLIFKHCGRHNLTLLPKNYLHIVENRSGEYWIIPIGDDTILDLEDLIKNWIETEYSGDYVLDGEIDSYFVSTSEYSARILLDGAKLDSVVCWESAGFYLTSAE